MTWRETTINEMTLTGSIVGQLLFGYLADKIGRQKLYGVELVIVIFATLGVTQSSYGLLTSEDGKESMSMSLVGWLSVWRFFMGIGIGAEYPLSAVITAE
jgi:MFS transporter, PHS family, inorganic phosphate transporter